MNAFDEARGVEERSQAILEPWLRWKYEHVVFNNGGQCHLETQKRYGDALIARSGESRWLEIKAEEEEKHGNLFLEVWSNKSQLNPGWMIHSRADLIFYHFVAQDVLYALKLPEIQRWAFDVSMGKPAISQYPLKPQDKYQQRNDTWGHCVPISVCQEVAGMGVYAPRQDLLNQPMLRAYVQSIDEWLEESFGPEKENPAAGPGSQSRHG